MVGARLKCPEVLEMLKIPGHFWNFWDSDVENATHGEIEVPGNKFQVRWLQKRPWNGVPGWGEGGTTSVA